MGKVVGFEISSQSPKEATKFYQDVFGWAIGEENWDYWPVSTGQDSIDGGIAKGPNDFPHGTRIQIEVDCIETAIEKAKVSGAMVVREKMEFDTFFLAYLVDPTGNGIGLIEKK